jgi:hypothetical protein
MGGCVVIGHIHQERFQLLVETGGKEAFVLSGK